MSNAPEKLQLLARQARVMATKTPDAKRADALRRLAALYEKQAEEIEAAGAVAPLS